MKPPRQTVERQVYRWLHPAMFKRDWLPWVAVGYVTSVAVLCTTVSFSLRPTAFVYPDRPTASPSVCGYEAAEREAAEAYAHANDPKLPPLSTEREVAIRQAEAADRKKVDARVCEERIGEAADLKAQWASAVAAKNAAAVAQSAFRWAGWELGALLLALGAAAWAAWETRRATVASREMGEAQARAYLMIRNRGSIRVFIQKDGLVSISIAIPFENAGATPAFNPSVKFRLFFFVPGPRSYRDVRPVLEETFENLGHLAPNGGEYLLERTLVTNQSMFVTGILQTARHKDFDGPHVYLHIELFINGSDFAGRPLQPYEVFVESRSAFLRDSSGGVTLELSHPDMITEKSAGYGPEQDFWVFPTRADLKNG